VTNGARIAEGAAMTLSREFRLALVAAAFALTQSEPASAFKPKTHVASANETLDQLANVITFDPAVDSDALTFNVNGQVLTVNVSARKAYRAVLDQPEFFRAGSVGPDGFLDPISGQLWAHSDQSPLLADIAGELTGDRPTTDEDRGHDPLSARESLAEFRSIDYATAMLRFAAEDYSFPGGDTEQEQVLAFIIGYISHGIGDSFAHTWINEMANGAWAVERGTGIYGPLTEEIKHVAVERFIDELLPNNLVNLPGDTTRQRLKIRAPKAFLDAFYSAPVSSLPSTPDPDASPEDFMRFFARVDLVHGGPMSTFFIAQERLADSIVGWSRLGPFFDLAEDYQLGGFENTLLDIADFPDQLKQDLAARLPAVDPWDVVTGGVVNCYDPIGGDTGPTEIEALRKAWSYLGTMNDRLDVYRLKAEAARRNWIHLSECTIQNITNLDCFEENVANPPAIRDACSVVADLPFEDEGNSNGLFRGELAEHDSPDVTEFLDEMRDAFRGGSDNAFEADSGHFRIGDNVVRMLEYFAGAGMVVDDFADVIVPSRSDDDGPSIRERYEALCDQVNDPAYEKCLNFELLPYAVAGRQAMCVAEHVQCVKDEVKSCLKEACGNACSLPVGCGNICGKSNQSDCKDACTAAFWSSPGTLLTCRELCGVFSSEEDSCTEAAVDVHKCDIEAVKCSYENMEAAVLGENYAQELLAPMQNACETVDDALEYVEQCFSSADALEACVCDHLTTAQCTQLQNVRQRAQQILNVLDSVSNEVCQHPAQAFVNAAFLWEDMLMDPLYLSSVNAALPSKFAEVNAMPPGPERTARLQALNAFQDLVNDATAFRAGNPIPLLTDPDDPNTVLANAFAMNLIPEFLGPTAIQVLNDVGTNLPQTFDPFFNAVQGMKLAPMTGMTDINDLVHQATGEHHVPWASYSDECSTVAVGPYCDVLKSFDDPNCYDCDDALQPDMNRSQWIPGRGLVAWNPYDPSGTVAKNVLTNFPLSSFQSAYDDLYLKVFRVPSAVPGWTGFADPANPWTSAQGGLSLNPSNRTEGGASLQVNNCGTIVVDSPVFSTFEFGVVGDPIAFDLFVPPQTGTPWFLGSAQLLVSIRGAGVTNFPLGTYFLSAAGGMVPNQWNTLSFTVPQNIQDILLGVDANAQYHIVLNLACGAPVLLDNLRFLGNLRERQQFFTRASSQYTVTSNPLFSFDDSGDWSSTSPLSAESQTKIEGAASLGVVPTFTQVKSRSFSTAELSAVTDRLNLDVYLPKQPPLPPQWWSGSLELFFTCGGLVNQSVGLVELQNEGFLGQFNSYEFTLPSNLVSILNGSQGTFTGCSVDVHFSMVNPQGTTFFLDNMGFIQADGTSGSGGSSGTGGSSGSGGGPTVDNCTGIAPWSVRTYSPGDLAESNGRLYECQPWPNSGWCGLAGAYEPGVGWAWTNAWIDLGPC
jgi:hypothetical protein